ncbi:uncharacterized protein LOC114797835 [Denticeps clupeoides]|uniref:uncharacterized protein LOC114797835 n=1 Tax=Denticeps clupeoides TaxID=299321 RepID=UPI0010A33149|nr:uncharacterized protein LOC114797835 [Denticeps clupeoides]
MEQHCQLTSQVDEHSRDVLGLRIDSIRSGHYQDSEEWTPAELTTKKCSSNLLQPDGLHLQGPSDVSQNGHGKMDVIFIIVNPDAVSKEQGSQTPEHLLVSAQHDPLAPHNGASEVAITVGELSKTGQPACVITGMELDIPLGTRGTEGTTQESCSNVREKNTSLECAPGTDKKKAGSRGKEKLSLISSALTKQKPIFLDKPCSSYDLATYEKEACDTEQLTQISESFLPSKVAEMSHKDLCKVLCISGDAPLEPLQNDVMCSSFQNTHKRTADGLTERHTIGARKSTSNDISGHADGMDGSRFDTDSSSEEFCLMHNSEESSISLLTHHCGGTRPIVPGQEPHTVNESSKSHAPAEMPLVAEESLDLGLSHSPSLLQCKTAKNMRKTGGDRKTLEAKFEYCIRSPHSAGSGFQTMDINTHCNKTSDQAALPVPDNICLVDQTGSINAEVDSSTDSDITMILEMESVNDSETHQTMQAQLMRPNVSPAWEGRKSEGQDSLSTGLASTAGNASEYSKRRENTDSAEIPTNTGQGECKAKFKKKGVRTKSSKPRNPKEPGLKRNINKRNCYGETRLHLASRDGDLAFVTALIEAGIDVNKADHAGWTALHEASQQGFSAVVEVLLAAGADVNSMGAGCVTALHDAAQSGRSEVSLFKNSDYFDATMAVLTEVENRQNEMSFWNIGRAKETDRFIGSLAATQAKLNDLLNKQQAEKDHLTKIYGKATSSFGQGALRERLMSLASCQRRLLDLLRKQNELKQKLQTYIDNPKCWSKTPPVMSIPHNPSGNKHKGRDVSRIYSATVKPRLTSVGERCVNQPADVNYDNYNTHISNECRKTSAKTSEHENETKTTCTLDKSQQLFTLITNGIITPGDNVLEVQLKGACHRASLLHNGTVRSTGNVFLTPEKWIESILGKNIPVCSSYAWNKVMYKSKCLSKYLPGAHAELEPDPTLLQNAGGTDTWEERSYMKIRSVRLIRDEEFGPCHEIDRYWDMMSQCEDWDFPDRPP